MAGHRPPPAADRDPPGHGTGDALPDTLGGALPDAAYAAALASVPGLGPRGLRALLDAGPPQEAWASVRRGAAVLGPRKARCAREAASVDVASVWRRHVDAGVAVSLRGGPGYPAALAPDPEAPAVLFALGDPTGLDHRPRAAVVGTRSATRYGLSVAAELGAGLAAAGVTVVSGLALGVDGAAHEGAVAACRREPRGAGPPVAVVAGGLGRPYPPQHAGLWHRVAACGAVVSEAPLGAADLAWRFPQRNRVIAALSEVVVVVECHARGGSLYTVSAAARRAVPVGAVPGSVRSPASAGTNALLADGCLVVRDLDDVLVALGLARAHHSDARPAGATGAAENGGRVAPADADAVAVLDALGWERCTVDRLLERCGLGLGDCAAALERLAAAGLVHGDAGWWERSGSG